MGKTAAGAVWLNADRLSPYDYWQFWRNADDGDVARFLRLFTELPMDEVAAPGRACRRRDQRGEEGAGDGGDTPRCTGANARSGGGDGAAGLRGGQAAEGLAEVDVPRPELDAGMPVASLLHLAGLASSRSDARRLIRGGGARVNGDVVTDENAVATPADLRGGSLILTVGRKRHVVVRAA